MITLGYHDTVEALKTNALYECGSERVASISGGVKAEFLSQSPAQIQKQQLNPSINTSWEQALLKDCAPVCFPHFHHQSSQMNEFLRELTACLSGAGHVYLKMTFLQLSARVENDYRHFTGKETG